MTDTDTDTDTDADRMRNNGSYLFMADFNSTSCADAIRWILGENLRETPKKNLTLIICSPGGDIDSCFALIDVMKGSHIPVHTVGIGTISSCGFMAFIAGEPGNRVLTPNTEILSHQYSSGAFGKEHDLISSNKRFELTSKRIIRHYIKCIDGMTEDKVRELLLPPQDVWLSAEEAVQLGCADQIKESY